MTENIDQLDDFFNGGPLPDFLKTTQYFLANSRPTTTITTTLQTASRQSNNEFDVVHHSVNSLVIVFCLIAITCLAVRMKALGLKIVNVTEFRRNHIYRSVTHNNIEDI